MKLPSNQTNEGQTAVLHVVLLMQASMGLLSGAAMLLFMGGNPLAIPIALGVPLLLFVLAAGVARRRRWARRGAYTIEVLILLGFLVGFLLGLLAAIDFTITVMTLVTNLAVPIVAIGLLRAQGHSEAAASRLAESAEVAA